MLRGLIRKLVGTPTWDDTRGLDFSGVTDLEKHQAEALRIDVRQYAIARKAGWSHEQVVELALMRGPHSGGKVPLECLPEAGGEVAFDELYLAYAMAYEDIRNEEFDFGYLGSDDAYRRRVGDFVANWVACREAGILRDELEAYLKVSEDRDHPVRLSGRRNYLRGIADLLEHGVEAHNVSRFIAAALDDRMASLSDSLFLALLDKGFAVEDVLELMESVPGSGRTFATALYWAAGEERLEVARLEIGYEAYGIMRGRGYDHATAMATVRMG